MMRLYPFVTRKARTGPWLFKIQLCTHHEETVEQNIFFVFSDKVLELVGGGSVINGAYPV